MAKLSGRIGPLKDFRNHYSLKAGGRVFDLSNNLLVQQNMDDDGTYLDVGGTLSFLGGMTKTNFEMGTNFDTPMVGAKFTAANSKATFSSSAVADALSFTTKELTISVWLSGSSLAQADLALSQSNRICSSGSNGIQFAMGPVRNPSFGIHYACAVLKGTASNYVASTIKLDGVRAADISDNTDYYGRYREVNSPFTLVGNETAVRLNTSAWNHVVYVQKAAENPAKLVYSQQFNDYVSPLEGTSATGNEGRCEMWLNGKLVYSTPTAGPFPQGHSPYFYEDGLEGLNGSTNTTFRNSEIEKRVLRQQDSVASISGSSTHGDAIAQLAIWNRCLTNEEISSIYLGSINGVYTEGRTSYSIAPKKLIGNDSKIDQPALNQGYSDSTIGMSVGPFTDSEVFSNRVYQGNNSIDEMLPESFVSVVSQTDFSKKQEKISTFIDSDDQTASIDDPEFVIPSGSAAIKIQMPNNDDSAVAVRFQWGETDSSLAPILGLSSTRTQVIGTGFLYYSPARKKWVEKRPDASTSQTGELNTTRSPVSASNFLQQAKENVTISTSRSPRLEEEEEPFILTNRIMSQFAWSPQFGYFVNHVEHLQQAGYERIGWPTGLFSAPQAPKYHAHDSETFKLRDYINGPFVLKRIELKIPVTAKRRFGDNPSGSATTESWEQQISAKKDIDNYVFFVYRQRRVSKERDSAEDRSTSKRYLIASASICYYNSASFGGAWSDGYYTDGNSPWSQDPNSVIYSGIAQPDATVDFFGQKLTKIENDNAILHNPQYIKNWGVERFIDSGVTASDSQTLRLVMLPTTVPECSVAPSLIPVTGNLLWDSSTSVDADERFSFREGGPDPAHPAILRCNQYVSSGSRDNPSSPSIAAPYLTLISNHWFGGTRPPAIASVNSSSRWASSHVPDLYDAIASPAELRHRATGTSPGIVPGEIDCLAMVSPTFVSGTRVVHRYNEKYFVDTSVRFNASRGPVQAHGVSILPSFAKNDQVDSLKFNDLNCQRSLDPQSINSPYPASTYSSPKFYGRKTYYDPDANSWDVEHNNKYMGYFGWRFISSFQIGDMTETQTYSPTILEPEDELIIGLDAGTFGPPDIDIDSLIPDGQGPTETLPHGTGLDFSETERSHKDTLMKEDYRYFLADSSIKIETGNAELILIGEYLQNGSPVSLSRDIPISTEIGKFYGEEYATDKNFLYNSDLLSGSMFTRVFTGSEGPSGILDGSRRYYYDAGSRRKF